MSRINIQIFHQYDKCSENEKNKFYKENFVIVKKYNNYYLCHKLDAQGNVIYRECFSVFDIDGVHNPKKPRDYNCKHIGGCR